jgi:hypothetical protein
VFHERILSTLEPDESSTLSALFSWQARSCLDETNRCFTDELTE